MIKIIPAVKLKPAKHVDAGWRQSQRGPEAIGQAMVNKGGQGIVSDRDADLIADMMGEGEAETPDIAYPAVKCGMAPTVINPDKDTVARMMIQDWVKQSGGVVVPKEEDKNPPAGPKLILG